MSCILGYDDVDRFEYIYGAKRNIAEIAYRSGDYV